VALYEYGLPPSGGAVGAGNRIGEAENRPVSGISVASRRSLHYHDKEKSPWK
jgi:hypothetical protein